MEEEKKDNADSFYSQEPINSDEAETVEKEMSVSDKFVGIFTSPAEVFHSVAKGAGKPQDWLIPLFALIVSVIISSSVITMVPTTKALIKEKSIEAMEKSLEEQIKSGQLTESQAQKAREIGQKQQEYIGTPIALVIQIFFISIVSLIVFVAIGGYFYFIGRFFLGAQFNFPKVLIVNALVGYITIIEIFIVLGANIGLGRILSDTSLATILGVTDKNILQYLLSRINIFSIWSYALMSMGYAIIAKSENKTKYYALVFGNWIGWTFLWFAVLSKLPMLSRFSL